MRQPVTIWLRQKDPDRGVEYLAVHDTDDGLDSLGWVPSRWTSIRGAQRGFTSESIEMGYVPTGRWTRDSSGEWHRRFCDKVTALPLGDREFLPARPRTGLTTAQLLRLSRGHIRRALESNLAEGWPLAEEFGYSELDAAAIVREIRRFIEKYTA